MLSITRQCTHTVTCLTESHSFTCFCLFLSLYYFQKITFHDDISSSIDWEQLRFSHWIPPQTTKAYCQANMSQESQVKVHQNKLKKGKSIHKQKLMNKFHTPCPFPFRELYFCRVLAKKYILFRFSAWLNCKYWHLCLCVAVLTCRMQLVMSEAILACGVSSSLPCGCRLCSRHDSHKATSAEPCLSIELVSRIAVVMRVMQISTTAWSLSFVT